MEQHLLQNKLHSTLSDMMQCCLVHQLNNKMCKFSKVLVSNGQQATLRKRHVTVQTCSMRSFYNKRDKRLHFISQKCIISKCFHPVCKRQNFLFWHFIVSCAEPMSGGDTLRRVVSDDNNNAQGGGSPCSTRYLQSTMHESVFFFTRLVKQRQANVKTATVSLTHLLCGILVKLLHDCSGSL